MRYVDYKTAELKFKFLFIAEKEKRGAEGQVQCFTEALASLYPQQKEISPQNIIEMLKKKLCTRRGHGNGSGAKPSCRPYSSFWFRLNYLSYVKLRRKFFPNQIN